MKQKIFLIAITIIFLGSCKKDMNLDKFQNVELNPEIGLPLAVVKLKLNKLIKPDSVTYYDDSNLIHFAYRNMDLKSLPIDTFIKIPAVDPSTASIKVGEQAISDANTSRSSTLREMTDNFSGPSKAILLAADGTDAIFPAIVDQNTNVVNLPISTADFTSAKISNGYLVIEIENHLPVTLTEMAMNIFNMIPVQTLLGTVNYSNIAPGASAKDSISLKSVTMTKNMGYNMPTFKTSTSAPSLVRINLNDYLKVNASIKNLKAIAGEIVFPTVSNIAADTMMLDIDADDNTAEIQHITFSKALINYEFNSTIQERINLKISFLGATKNNVAFAPIEVSVDPGQLKGTIDLSNVRLDLTQDPSKPFNKLAVLVKPTLVSSGVLKSFDSSDYINASFTFSDFEFQSVEGYLGTRAITFDADPIEINLLNDLISGIRLDNPVLKIFTENSLGVPITVSLDAKGISSKGIEQSLDAQPFLLPYPTTMGQGIVTSTQYFNKTNSKLVDLLALPPVKIGFAGKAELNKDIPKSYTNFIEKSATIKVGFEMDVPLALQTSDFKLSDTLENPFFKMNPDSTLGEFFMGDGFKLTDLDYVELLVKMNNGFPFDGNLNMYFADKYGVIKDSIVTNQFISSAIPDVNGKTVTNTIASSSVKLTSAQLQNMKAQNLNNIIVIFHLSTYNNGSQVVKVYSDYESQIGLSAKLKLKIKK
jgi:hypothetical protein